jgi:hypothetical protein
MAVITTTHLDAPGFVPGQLGSQMLPVVNNHQSAFIASNVSNVTNTNAAIKASENGSLLVRDPLDQVESMRTAVGNHLYRPGQKPVSLVRACMN